MRIALALVFTLLASCIHCLSAVRLKPIASGFERPVWAGMPAQSHGRLWVIEQSGKIWILDLKTGQRLSQPFLDLSSKVTRAGNEQGLLGLAFDPNFMKNGRFYVDYTDLKNRTCIVRFKANKNRLTANPEQGQILLRFDQPYHNHNGGWIHFGPDGMLYIGTGDGGFRDDPHNNGQSLSTFLGKLLRIDVSPDSGYQIPADNPFIHTPGAKPEIWAFGLRNPWRCSFDRKTGDLWIGDVGQNHWEEIDHIPHGKGAGANFGWRLREGDSANPAPGVGGPPPPGYVAPIYVYNHGGGPRDGLSVTGGYVYRGSIKELQGCYIFADYQIPRIWSFRDKDGKPVDFQDHSKAWQPKAGSFNLISSFAEDNSGELYVVSLSGNIYKLAAY